MDKEKSPDDIIAHFRRSRAMPPLGTPCGEGAGKDTLKSFQGSIDVAYCDILGVKKNPKDEAYEKRLVDLATGKTSSEEAKKRTRQLGQL